MNYLGTLVDENNKDEKLIKALARCLNPIAKKVEGLILDGYRFHTKDLQEERMFQNFGVMV